MTLNEYIDPARFPATTQGGLSPKQQLIIDAFNYDQLRQHFDGGGELDDEQRVRWVELQTKMRHRAALLAELPPQ